MFLPKPSFHQALWHWILLLLTPILQNSPYQTLAVILNQAPKAKKYEALALYIRLLWSCFLWYIFFNFIIKFSLSHQIQKKAPGRRGFRRRTVKWSEVEGNPVKSANHSSMLPEYHCTRVPLYCCLQGSTRYRSRYRYRRYWVLSISISMAILFYSISIFFIFNENLKMLTVNVW